MYFLKDGTMMTSGKRFYARNHIDCFTSHMCELPSIAGARDRTLSLHVRLELGRSWLDVTDRGTMLKDVRYCGVCDQGVKSVYFD